MPFLYRSFHVPQRAVIRIFGPSVKQHPDDLVHRLRMSRHKVHYSMHSDLRGLVHRIRIHSGRNRGKRNTPDSLLHRQLQRIPITVAQKLRLIMTSAVPDRPDRMNDILARKPIGSGDLRLARRASVQRAAFLQQLSPRCAVNRTVDATAAEQRVVGCVHDCGYEVDFCYIALYRSDNSIVLIHSSPSPRVI